MYVNRYSPLWDHTVMRVVEAEKKAKNNEDFVKKMVTRLKKITHEEKIHYAIAVLKERGHQDVVDIYESTFIMEELLKSSGKGKLI